MRLKRESHLDDAPAQQDQADGPDQGKDKLREIIDHRQRVIRRQGRHDREGQDGHQADEHGVCLAGAPLRGAVVKIVFHAAFSFSS